MQLASVGMAQTACEIFVPERIEISKAFSLVDLLREDGCPGLRERAASTVLGLMPSPGSIRVLEGTQVRIMLERVLRSEYPALDPNSALHVPERVSVRRAGARWSCEDIVRDLFSDAAMPMDCGSNAGIPQTAALELSQKRWDASTRTWRFVVRCRNPKDCVPFVVSLRKDAFPAANEKSEWNGSRSTSAVSARLLPTGFPGTAPPLVHRGDKVNLVWEQDGIRVVAPAFCMDEGREGDDVRARISGHVIGAVVVRMGELRAEISRQ